MKDNAYYKDLAARCLMPNYGERDIALVRGEGARVWDADGREYLDFLAGISVNNLGHCPPAVVEALCAQARQLMHTSNFYIIAPQAELARRLCELSFAERCLFANSGAEVNEGAVKLARLYSKRKYGAGRHEIITMRNSFHGRTIGMISATGQEKVRKDFEPLLEGFRYADLNNLDSVLAQISGATCGIMLEPVQGEGGIIAASAAILRGLREECDQRDLLLIFDEIQCGMGRCGKLFAYQLSGVAPDIMTLAKALGNGMPIGALLAGAKTADIFTPGAHGTTFGGNPLACAAALAVLDEMTSRGIPELSARRGEFLRGRLRELMAGCAIVREIRGIGLMTGVELTCPGADVVKKCAARGLLVNCTVGCVIRILPPLIVTEDECERAAGIIAEVIADENELQQQKENQDHNQRELT